MEVGLGQESFVEIIVFDTEQAVDPFLYRHFLVIFTRTYRYFPQEPAKNPIYVIIFTVSINPQNIMNVEYRIPELGDVSLDGALQWFAEMQCRGLLFHPDDDPADIIVIQSSERMFNDREIQETRSVLDTLFAALGNGVYEVAYPVMMNACGIRLDA